MIFVWAKDKRANSDAFCHSNWTNGEKIWCGCGVACMPSNCWKRVKEMSLIFYRIVKLMLYYDIIFKLEFNHAYEEICILINTDSRISFWYVNWYVPKDFFKLLGRILLCILGDGISAMRLNTLNELLAYFFLTSKSENIFLKIAVSTNAIIISMLRNSLWKLKTGQFFMTVTLQLLTVLRKVRRW